MIAVSTWAAIAALGAVLIGLSVGFRLDEHSQTRRTTLKLTHLTVPSTCAGIAITSDVYDGSGVNPITVTVLVAAFLLWFFSGLILDKKERSQA